MKVTVVIPNYNGIKYIKKCMEALSRQSYLGFDTIIVDNYSTDGSREYIREAYPFVQLICLEKNYGFSKAVNEGIVRAKTPYIILLNNDTEVHFRFVEELLSAIEKSEQIFAVSSRMINYYDREKIDDAGDYYTILGWAIARGVMQQKEVFNTSCEIFSACAGAAIYRKKIFYEIGLFDENYFAYFEDLDIGYRARIAGYKNIYEPCAMVYHIGSATSGSRYNSFKVRLAARNSVYVNYKNMPFLQLLLNIIPLVLGYILKNIYFIKKGYGWIYFKGVINGILTVSHCKKVKFQWKNMKNYLRIEYELIRNFVICIKEMRNRK